MAAIDRKLKGRLAAAACTLLGGTPAAHAGRFEGWDVDAAVLYYKESGRRVSALEPVLNVRKSFEGERSLNLKLVLDALTGATPNGAIPSRLPQTFTRPSGRGTYVVAPNETPLDDTFHDTRISVNGTWQQPLDRLSKLTSGLTVSTEYDFLSLGGNVLYARDFDERNRTLSLGLSLERDLISPVGGVPTRFGTMGTGARQGDGETKTVYDVLLGLTQVIDPRTVAQLNYSLSLSKGYLNDPYKVVTLVDPATGDPLSYLYESRPDTRMKHALYAQIRRRLARDVVGASYRFFLDDWGVRSHTADLTYRWRPSERWWLEPHGRFYRQSAADFYRTRLFAGAPLPARASADYRLGAFKAYTTGLQFGWNFANETALVLKAEYYMARGEVSPYPDLEATIFQLQYRF